MDQDKPRRKPAVRFTAARRAAALGVMAETGNKAAAAEAAGVDPTTITQWLKKDADFVAVWAAAAEAVGRRLAGARSPPDGVGDGRFETIQRTPAGQLQIRAVRPGKWNKAVEDRFFAALRTCGNVAACARLTGFSEKLGVLRKRHLTQGCEDESAQLIPPGRVRVATEPTESSADEGDQPGRKGSGIPDRVRDDDKGGPG